MQTIAYTDRIIEALTPLNPTPMTTYRGDDITQFEKIETEMMVHTNVTDMTKKASYTMDQTYIHSICGDRFAPSTSLKLIRKFSGCDLKME